MKSSAKEWCPTRLILEEYLAGEQLFTHALQLPLGEGDVEEVFLINDKGYDALAWLNELQQARRTAPDCFLAIGNSPCTTRSSTI